MKNVSRAKLLPLNILPIVNNLEDIVSNESVVKPSWQIITKNTCKL